MSLIVNDVLESVSRVLIEDTFNSTLPAPVGIGAAAIALVDPAIYVGALLVVGAGASLEVVPVTAITANNFTATFAKAHLAGEAIRAATFPSGQISQYVVGSISSGATVSPLFTQAEMLGYFRDVQNEFLEATRMIYASATQVLTQNTTIYSSPVDSVRIERIDIAGVALWNVSQAELDMDNIGWAGAGAQTPQNWYQDHLNTAQYALSPKPPLNPGSAELWYSQKGTTTPALSDGLIVPDIFWPYTKYGVLEKAWSKDGETKDPRRAAYCQKRFIRGVGYGRKFMDSIQAAMAAAR